VTLAVATRTVRCAATLSLATWEQVKQDAGILNLAVGQPAPSLLPMAALQAAADVLSSTYDPRHLLQYGSMAGSRHYLTAVASFLSDELGHPHDAANLFASPGNSGGLALVARTLTRPGDSVLMEEPSYFLAHQVFRDHQLNLLPAPQCNRGGGTLDIDQLSRMLQSLSSTEEQMPRLLYCVPTGSASPCLDHSTGTMTSD